MNTLSAASSPRLSTLANGLRIVAIPMPWRATLSLSVFIRTGSLHESARLNGISHVVEHMAFKGTAGRSCQRINLDAEGLGAELNAHTDKDHTAFHIEGLPGDLPAFVELLADIVLNSSFPAEELERERGVILQEFSEFEDDPTSAAFQLLDRACYGPSHAAGRPIIGTRANIQRFEREDLLDYARRQYTASNMVVTVAGPVDADEFSRLVEQVFGALPTGSPNALTAPSWLGGLKTRRMAGSGQCQVLLGFEAPSLTEAEHLPHVLAAALLGEGMSSPLLDEVRERRGLAYHVACSADILPLYGQFLIEGATAPGQAEEFLQTVHALLQRQAQGPLDPVALARARKQLQMRALRALEQPARRMEGAAQDLFNFGRLRDPQEQMARLQAVSAAQVQAVFEQLLQPSRRPAVALAGSVPPKVKACAEALFLAG
ncbi:putative Zn-dependent peptidase [Paucibacter oligotrophus]|uniref:Putative Zn-dependent peptidase n=1 Tax=Roseateles oligotrophus TaxID=1769250 RepID=A0A840L836_9BURK|nr:pitrilysin family protein [Roseateles oligotrophus]MBB4842832.1 putative Zn-dependent peptidase [Roseateles oligotrophus]